MLVVTEADAAAIRDVLDQESGLSAAIELRPRFPGVSDNEGAGVRRDHCRMEAAASPAVL